MKKRFLAFVVCLVLIVSAIPGTVSAAAAQEEIVILYENDVHCLVEGYSKLAAMKKELEQTHKYVGVVSSGDYIQGTSLGVVSEGEYIARLMSIVGYDAVAIGNHEFDYRLPRLNELIEIMDTTPVCCNFQKIGEEDLYFEPYTIVSYGPTDIAYIGITTPDTIASSSPAQFKDDQGNYIYTFNATALPEMLQSSIDSAKAAGADYIVALSHIGDTEVNYNIAELVASTTGLDVVLDAHSHNVIENRVLTDAQGNEVVISSTGTKFEHIGKLTISGDGITTQLIRTEDYQKTDPEVDAYLEKIEKEYGEKGNRKVAVSEVKLITNDEQGNRLVRKAETNLGNMCSDAFRIVTGADIGYVNGGGIRQTIEVGDVTFNDLLNVFPFNNHILVAQIKGQDIKDMLEMALSKWPNEEGTFPHVSGITFCVNTALQPSVVVDEYGTFVDVSGQYRVYDIAVLNRETGEYEPIDLDRTYTYTSHNYYLLEYGGGMSMLKNAEIIQNNGMLDVELLEVYLVDHLGGVIGQQYAHTQNRIRFVDDPAGAEPERLTHTVRWGDTLWALSRRYGCTVDDLVAWNREQIKDPDRIYVGWELKVG